MKLERNQVFRIAVRQFGPFERAMERFWNSFAAETGNKLQLDMVVMDLHQLYAETIANEGLANGAFDVAHINTDWLAAGYDKKAFEILNPYMTRSPLEGFPHAWSASLLGLQRFGDQVVGVPFHDGPECLLLRRDLFEDPEEQRNYQAIYRKPLQAPETWEDFHQIARFFQRPEQGIYGSIFACYPDGHNAVFDFCLQLWTRGGALEDANGKININTTTAADSLRFYRDLVTDAKAVHPGSACFESVAAGAAFARGEAAMMINWFGFAAMCEVDTDSKVKGRVHVTGLPAQPGSGSASLNVYWVYAMGSGSPHKQVAYNFMRYATAAPQDKDLTLGGGIGCRISTWKDPDVNKVIPYYHKLEHLHDVARVLPRSRQWPATAAVIDNLVTKALEGGNISGLLREAQTEIDLLQ
ncbi:extracellular solute-binding protein [Pedobacter sp. SYP-B3415]|uniref:extracellular solute-binding protein n=1 Tax=Pedobacter sp. SYP-B3415 TaxID=2496641 RepID=UPI00101CEFEB|nr:extracellular solute-binding protein [Pedobacter sp. SYP-B3415]